MRLVKRFGSERHTRTNVETQLAPEARVGGYDSLNEVLGLPDNLDLENLPDLDPKKNAPRWIGAERAEGLINEFRLREKRHPNRWDLNLASSTHTIKLTHRSGTGESD